jgi:hypothetical protein
MHSCYLPRFSKYWSTIPLRDLKFGSCALDANGGNT